MNKKIVSGLAVGATLILLLAVLYYLSTGNAPKTASTPVTAPGAPTVKAPAKPETLPAAPAQPTAKNQPVAPGIEPAGPPKGVAPSPEPLVTVLPPLEPSQHYGILAGSYKKFGDAARMLARLKKQGNRHLFSETPGI